MKGIFEMKRLSLLLTILALLTLAACTSAAPSTTTADATGKTAGASVPTAQAGKGVVTAKITNKDTNTPAVSQLIRLAKIYGEGTDSIYVYNESADPGEFTTEDGTLIITNVEPGPYAVILVDGNGNYAPIDESAEKILTVEVAAGQVVDLGNITISIAPPGN